MKKILILTAGYGEGHNTAARNIRAGIEAIAPGEAEPRVIDLLEITYGRLNTVMRETYLLAINHAPAVWEKFYALLDSGVALKEIVGLMGALERVLRTLIEQEKPHAIVSCYPLYNHILQKIYNGAPERRSFAQITVITDSITINSVWYSAGSDAYVVANEATAAVMQAARVPTQRLHVLGFPVALQFANRPPLRRTPGPGECWRVLYVINSGKQEAPALIRELLKIERIELQVTVGKDEKLRAAVDDAIAESGRFAEVIGWTARMPELMYSAHLLISKAGGATVQESLAALTPLLMTQVIPGQEEGNARLLLENRCGALANTAGEVVSTVQEAFANDGELWREWCCNIESLSRPNSSREIARFILQAAPPA